MTIREMSDLLDACVNKDATVHVVVGGPDEDLYDTIAVELWSDHSEDGYQDIFARVDPMTDLAG